MKRLLLSLFILSAGVHFSQAQQRIVEKIDIQQKPKSIATGEKQAVNPEVNALVQEVFRDCPEVVTERELRDYEAVMQRISLISVADLPKEAVLLSLASRILRTKCNADLVFDNATNFSKDTFNPFKYIINFHSKADQYFLIDGTEYVLHVRAVN